MSISKNKLKELLRKLIQKEMEEASMTGNLDGGAGPPKTPYMFQSKPKSKKDKEKEKKIATAGGYTKVTESKFAVKFTLGGTSEDEMATIIVDASSEGEAKMMVAKNLRKGKKAIISTKRLQMSKAKQVDKRLESVNEGQYHNYRNDDTMTPRQKIGLSMREVRDKLNELDKLVKINVRLKNELNVDSKTYWKRTHVAMKKISERLVKLANKVGQLY